MPTPATEQHAGADQRDPAARPRPDGATREKRRAEFARLFDREPPFAPEAEMALLGALLLDPKMLADVVPFIQSGEQFYSPANAIIFDTIVQTHDFVQNGDIVLIVDALRAKGVLKQVGDAAYLLQLGESSPSPAAAPYYARIVSEKARLRRLIHAAEEMLYDAYHAGDFGPEGARDVLDKAQGLIFDIAEKSDLVDAEMLNELLHQAMLHLEQHDGRLVTGLSTGFADLDEMTSGLQRGEFIVIAARPSMGKTALALNLAEQVALSGESGSPTPVAIYSLEMSRLAVANRMMCARSGVDSHLLRTNRLGPEHYRRLFQACDELRKASIYIDDSPGLSVFSLRTRARRLVARHGIRCVIVDYLQLLTAPAASRESRQVEVSAISRGIKSLARELNIPVICLSQLNRGSEQREGHRPRMSDLRESGSIEQDADVVMLLHREEYYHQADPQWAQENPDKAGVAELIIAKQRNGPTGHVELVWDARTTRFKPYAGRQYAPHTPSYTEPKGGAGHAGSGARAGALAGAGAASASRARPEAPFHPAPPPRSAPDERKWDEEADDEIPV